MNIRAVSYHDACFLNKLHERCFDEGWSQNYFESLLENNAIQGLLCEVNVDRKISIIAFVLFQVVCGESDILTLCVDPLWRRQKIAQILIEKMIEELKKQGVKICTLEVNSKNCAAIDLYKKFSFETVSIRKNYYKVNREFEDALLLQKIFS